MTENVSSQPAPQDEALLRLEPGAQNQSASLGSSSLLVWGETRGGKGHWLELLLDTEGRRAEPGAESFAGCRSRALSHTGSVLDTLTWAQWQQELSLLAVGVGRDLFPPSPCHGTAVGSRGNKSH